MGWKESAEPVLTRMPSIKQPQGHVPFKKKLIWTAGVLIAYFTLTNVLLFGLKAGGGSDLFGQFRSILAGSQGSILQLGIGPIVTASIVLQLLGGADLLGLDKQDPRDQAIYQGLQKFLVFVMVVLTGAPMVFAGGFLQVDPAVAQSLGISLFALKFLMFLQVALGGVIILFMDEIVSKWGVGSGIGLFIIAGVSQRLVGGIIQIASSYLDMITGALAVNPLTANGLQTLIMGPGQLLPILTTILIFAIVVYAESVRVEIPLSHARVKGARGRFPVKLVYASVLPMILVRALQMNLQFLGRILNAQLGSDMPAWLGQYVSGQPSSGLFYYLAPIQSPDQWMWWSAATAAEPWQIMIRVAIDLTFMVAGGALFALYWVETTGMGPKDTAKQIQNSGMQIPGFRQNTSVMEQVMERYIPYVTILGGALVGLLAVMANMLGSIGGVSGTGLLLMVSITYKLYEEVAEESLMDNPMLRKMMGGDS